MTDYVQELLAGNFQFVSPSCGLESEGEALYVYRDHPVYFELREWPHSGQKYQVWADDRCVLETNIEETI